MRGIFPAGCWAAMKPNGACSVNPTNSAKTIGFIDSLQSKSCNRITVDAPTASDLVLPSLRAVDGGVKRLWTRMNLPDQIADVRITVPVGFS